MTHHAPCGHVGAPVIGRYVACLAGCDGPPRACGRCGSPKIAAFPGHVEGAMHCITCGCVWRPTRRDHELRELRRGDVPKTIRARAFTVEGFPDLSTYTGLTFRMVGPVTVKGAAVGLASGYLEYTFTGTELDVLGDYVATFRGTSPEGEPQTFPEATNLRVRVIPAV